MIEYIQMNMTSIFQQFRNINTSQLSDLLQASNIEMNQLLDEQCFVGQFRNNNSQLLEFMTYDRFKQLIQYITVVGPQNDQKRSYKYPNLASQILSTQNNKLIAYFLPQNRLEVDEEVLEQIQLEKQEQIDSLRSSQSYRSQMDQNDFNQLNTPQQSIHLTTQNQNTLQNQKELNTHNDLNQSNNQQNQLNANNSLQQPTNVEISPDDFPEVRVRTKKIKVKQLVKKINKKEVPPLINKLFDYFDSSINYTLTAYVSKVLQLLFTKKPSKFCQYFFNYNKRQPKLFIKILNHIQSKSVGDLLISIICYDSDDYRQQKQQICWFIINNISTSTDTPHICGLGYVLTELIERISIIKPVKPPNQPAVPPLPEKVQQFLKSIFNTDFLRKVCQIALGQNQCAFLTSRSLLILLLKAIPPPNITNPDNLIHFQRIIETIMMDGLYIISQHQNSTKFTPHKLRILECLSYILSNNFVNSRQALIFADQKIIKNILTLFQLYPLNNMLHNELVILINSILEGNKKPNTDNRLLSIYQNLLSDNCLLGLVSRTFNFLIAKSHQVAYCGQIVLIMKFLNSILAQNHTLQSVIDQNKKWFQVIQNYNEWSARNHLLSLGGYNSRKMYTCTIMFDKKEILNFYDFFLTKNNNELCQQDFDFVSECSEDEEQTHNQKQKNDASNQKTVSIKGLQQRTQNLQLKIEQQNGSSQQVTKSVIKKHIEIQTQQNKG